MRKLKSIRLRAHLTATALAQRSGVAVSTIVRLEKDPHRHASYENVVYLARALGVSPDELCPVPRRRRRRRRTPEAPPILTVLSHDTNGGEA